MFLAFDEFVYQDVMLIQKEQGRQAIKFQFGEILRIELSEG